MNTKALSSMLRFGLAAVLFATAAGKLLDVRGFAAILETYRAFPPAALAPLALTVPLVELALSMWLLSGWRLAAAAAGSAAMHALYAGWSGAALARGLDIPNCGCFGIFFARPLTIATVVEDLVLTGLSLLLGVRLALPQRRVA